MATEPTTAAEIAATETSGITVTVHPEPTNDKIDINADFFGTTWVKWDVKGGGDRTHEPYINTNYSLEGSPSSPNPPQHRRLLTLSNIQGVEIKSAVDVKLICWSSSTPTGTPNITIEGPTGGKHQINPRRLGSYRVELR
ncbi:hypothetical protein CJF32_00005103 [Rutstroemia sp. NJR-2017a WRK4]|nr:hypothetical protein CJF32_00005103 [Rutstroemia sp. NJR-2017a WRK4]